MSDAVGGNGSSHMDNAAAVGHLVLARVLAGVVIINRVYDTQIEEETIQHLGEDKHINTFLRGFKAAPD